MRARIFIALLIVIALSTCANAAMNLFHADKSGDETLNALINDKANKFTLANYIDDVTSIDLTYNVYLPEEYSSDKKFPVVFFIADGSSVGKEARFSLTQGYGALVWPEDCIVIVPVYPVTVLDDHKGFVTSDYVDLTGRFVKYAMNTYSIDKSRVYATGQSMGCMTFLVLAAKNPELFTACLFVSGQWDINALKGLTGQRFVYVASAGDDKASKGQAEVINMFNKAKVPYLRYDDIDAKNAGIYLPVSQAATFVTFRAGTTLPEVSDAGKYSEHMTSFDYAYRMQELREWLLAQTR